MAADNSKPLSAPAGDSNAPFGLPFYEKQRQRLKDLVAARRSLERRLMTHEDAIFQKETEYLENTPSGNIITGFDNYTKGTGTSAAAQRKKMSLTDQNRVFSKSSISYNPNTESNTPDTINASTPVSHALTPPSASFASSMKDGISDLQTPTSAICAGPRGVAGNKKKKAVALAGDDSDTDTRENKKVRTAFGAVRK